MYETKSTDERATARLLVECGADPNSRDEDFSTCLHVAAANRPAKAPVVQG